MDPDDPLNHYLGAKAVDQHVGREWTYPVFVSRSMARASAPGEAFYEPLSSYEQVRRQAGIAMDLALAGAPDVATPNVSLGVEWTRAAFYAQFWTLPPKTAEDEFVGRHVLSVVSMQDHNETIVFFHRWSEWGDAPGFGYLRRKQFDEYVDDIWLNRSSVYGSGPEFSRDTNRSRGRPILEKFRQAWMTRREVNSRPILALNQRSTLYWRQVRSERTGRAALILELHGPVRLAARAHLLHGGPTPAEIDELYVWPNMRNRGYGRFMIDQLISAARDNGHDRITFPLYEADALAAGGLGALSFMGRTGFSVSRVSEQRPSVMYRGELVL